MSDEEASSSLIDPRDDHIAAIRELQLIVQDLQIQNEQLSEQLYALERFQIDAEQRPRANMNQPRFYAILRGHFDHENNTFTRGIYDDPDEVALVTRQRCVESNAHSFPFSRRSSTTLRRKH